MIHQLNSETWPVWAELTVVLLYPFASLLVCTLVGLGARKLSTALTGDFFFSPPARLTPVQATR